MHHTFDHMPVTHARQVTGRFRRGSGRELTDQEMVAYGWHLEDCDTVRREAHLILDQITPEDDERLTYLVFHSGTSTEMNEFQCSIRDRAELALAGV